MKKLLVTGISGFLGWHVANFKQSKWHIQGLYNQQKATYESHSLYQINFQNTNKLFELLDQLAPEAIMHLAAMSSPALCDKYVDESYRTNVVIPTLLAEYAQRMDIPFLFTSTDMVFSGDKAPYSPSDATQPISIYGKEKAEAEKRILCINPQATIVRLPLLFGFSPSGNNFCQQWINQLAKGETIHAFTDEYRSTISGTDAAKGLFLLLDQRLQNVWHLGGVASWSRYTFGVHLAELFGYPSHKIIPTTLEANNLIGKRPANLTLDSRTSHEAGFLPLPIQESLGLIQKHWA